MSILTLVRMSFPRLMVYEKKHTPSSGLLTHIHTCTRTTANTDFRSPAGHEVYGIVTKMHISGKIRSFIKSRKDWLAPMDIHNH